jgi:hypothetical protein
MSLGTSASPMLDTSINSPVHKLLASPASFVVLPSVFPSLTLAHYILLYPILFDTTY